MAARVTLTLSSGEAYEREVWRRRGSLGLVHIAGLSIFDQGPWAIIHLTSGKLVLDGISDEIVGEEILIQTSKINALQRPDLHSEKQVKEAVSQARSEASEIFSRRGYYTVGGAYKVRARVKAARDKRHTHPASLSYLRLPEKNHASTKR